MPSVNYIMVILNTLGIKNFDVHAGDFPTQYSFMYKGYSCVLQYDLREYTLECQWDARGDDCSFLDVKTDTYNTIVGVLRGLDAVEV